MEQIEELFAPLVLKCKEKGRAMRIGTNHGSLSARVMSYWGDSPRGMVESAIEFAKICRKYDYHNFLFSMKVTVVGCIRGMDDERDVTDISQCARLLYRPTT